MNNKNIRYIRIRKKLRKRYRIKQLNTNMIPRLSVFKSCKHFYASLIDCNGNILVHSSTLLNFKKNKNFKTYNKSGVELVAKDFSEKINKNNNKKFIIDSSGYSYKGKVKYFFDTVKQLTGFDK